MAKTDPPEEHLEFQLLWTIGFGGKRHVPPQKENEVQQALVAMLKDLNDKAKDQNAKLTTTSSISRGGDALFASAVLESDTFSGSLPWKCLLPFSWDAFIQYDLSYDVDGKALDDAEFQRRKALAESLCSQSFTKPVIVSPGASPSDPAQREEAYLECGYRTVDDADVLVFLLNESEYHSLFEKCDDLQPAWAGVGTYAIASYARIREKPMILLNLDAEDIFASRTILNDPDKGSGGWFVDPVISGLIKESVNLRYSGEVERERISQSPGPMTLARRSIVQLGARLDAVANRQQKRTIVGLTAVLLCHFSASSMAAIMATGLIFGHMDHPSTLVLGAFVFVLTLKPALAFAAWITERLLHQRGFRENWLVARILSEVCRSANATWPLPVQPTGIFDEEDFPKVGRLIRTLSLLREQDKDAPVSGTPPEDREPESYADMRQACRQYIECRVKDQYQYFSRQHAKALRQARMFRLGFQLGTWTAIASGLMLLVLHLVTLGAHAEHFEKGVHLLEAAMIIAPFMAAFSLGMMTIRDVQRRCSKYNQMKSELDRLSHVLKCTYSNHSRLALIEHIECLLLEEQHEWFSVMRNFTV